MINREFGPFSNFSYVEFLHGYLNTALVTGSRPLEVGEKVGNVVPRMSVQTGPQALLVEVVRDETDGPTKDEEPVEDTVFKVVFGFLGRESTAVTDKIDEADGDASIDIQNQIVLLTGGDGLDGKSVVKELVRREVLEHVVLDQLDAEIGVVS
jgi:hypothetical protein